MIEQMAAARLLAVAFKKPLEDMYGAAKGATREAFKQLSQKSTIDELYARIEQVGTIRTITSRQPISIRSIYYPAKIKTQGRPMAIDTANDLSNGANLHTVITGTVGQGKSVLLKYLCIREIETGNGLPILIELRHTSSKKSLNDLSIEYLHNIGFKGEVSQEFLDLLFSKRFVTFFLDGYDEVNGDHAIALRSEIQNLAQKHPSLRIIVSSRPAAISQHLDSLVGFNYIEIYPLSPPDFEPFLEKIGTAADTRKRIIKAIQSSKVEIRQLITTPLMLTLVVSACGTRPVLPDTLPDFYETLFGVMVATHDETKPGYIRDKSSKISNNNLEQLFKAFCFTSKEEANSTSLSPKEFSNSLKKAKSVVHADCTTEQFKSDLTEVVCLMAKDGLNTAFIHKSIQEYYAAAFVADIDDDLVVGKIYNNIREGDYFKWSQELQFLKEIDSHRYKKFYLIPSATATLKVFNYKENSPRGSSEIDITKALKLISPRISYNEERDDITTSINVSTISNFGIKQYVFTALNGIPKIVKSALSEDEFQTFLHAHDSDGEYANIASSRTKLGKEIRLKVRENLKNIEELKRSLEADVKNKRDNLLSIISTKNG